MDINFKVRDLTLKFVAATKSAYRIVENPELSDLISYVSGEKARLPTAKTLKSDLDTTYCFMKNALIDVIDKSEYVCLTADLWTNKARSYMGVTIHLFDEALNRQSYLLAFRRMYGRHTHMAIKEMLINVIKEFKIKKSKITHIITDGARNFGKAFSVDDKKDNTNDDDVEHDIEIDIDELLLESEENFLVPPDTRN